MSETFQIEGTSARAYLMINCESGSEQQILDELKTFQQIKESTLTIGRHDILALIEARSIEDLRDLIEARIRRIPEIRCTTTLVCTQLKDLQ